MSASPVNGAIRQPHVSKFYDGAPKETAGPGTGSQLNVMCGPLLNYQHMSEEASGTFWHGSVLLVIEPSERHPRLEVRSLGPVAQVKNARPNGFFSRARSRPPKGTTVEGLKLYSDPTKTFWRFALQIPLGGAEIRWEYTIPDMHFRSEVSTSCSRDLVVPSVNQSMRIMFHSCNGFSVGTDEDYWSGPALWNNVLEVHEKRPFHVMIGGGDQIYNDGVRVNGPLKKWTGIANPKRRRDHPFGEDLRADCDDYYFDNYVRWFSTEPFAAANASIPQINIWDDHDIIDGFGSYTNHFMQCPVFRGIGGVSFKYYCLFQHHTAPPQSTFTTDSSATMNAMGDGSAGPDPQQLQDTYVYPRTADDPSWIVGNKPGPYVEERSRSLYVRLGKRMAFCGIDARTERTRRQVNYPETYDLIFDRLHRELARANGQIRHLILLLGIPIAYPRLAWLENVLNSPIIAPIRLLNKRFGLAGGFFNHFDGKADLLDDLDDHYTSKQHKQERKQLMLRLQEVSQEFGVRVTILGGDVHLGALGRFYSAPKMLIPAEHDHRYMANIISSAITNRPPPEAVANLLARRNKIHHLRDGTTDETLLKFFDRQPGGMVKSANWNQCTMPSRNYACITEVDDDASLATPMVNDSNGANEKHPGVEGIVGDKFRNKDGHSPLHEGEEGAGTQHPAADGVTSNVGIRGGLNVSLRVEIDNHDRKGATEGYGLSIPPLTLTKIVA